MIVEHCAARCDRLARHKTMSWNRVARRRSSAKVAPNGADGEHLDAKAAIDAASAKLIAARRIVCFVARAVARIIEEAFRGVITLTAAHLREERGRSLRRFRHRKRNYSVNRRFWGA